MSSLPPPENPAGSMEEAVRALTEGSTFLLVPHKGADGDSICSCGALALALRARGKKVFLLSQEKLPEQFALFPFAGDFLSQAPEEPIDCFVCMECTNRQRIPDAAVKYLDCGAVTVNLDHHRNNKIEADIHYIDYRASSLCEIVYFLLEKMKAEITPSIAQALYTGILTDTGGFVFSSASSVTFEVLAQLLQSDFNPSATARKIMKSVPLSHARLRGAILSDLRISENGLCTWAFIPEVLLRELQIDYSEVQNLTEAVNIVAGTAVFALFREEKDSQVAVSLRSNDDRFNVRLIAEQYGGGGHNAAAGCTVAGTLESVSASVLERLNLLFGSSGSC